MADLFEENFRALIRSPAVIALVGERVVWGEVPAGKERPMISLWNTTREHDYHMTAPSGLKQGFVQLDVWGMSYAQAKQVARAVVDTIDGYAGAPDATDFQGIFVRGERESNEPIAGSPAQRYFRCTVDVEVWYAATTDAES